MYFNLKYCNLPWAYTDIAYSIYEMDNCICLALAGRELRNVWN
jgi:hypothetical protein